MPRATSRVRAAAARSSTSTRCTTPSTGTELSLEFGQPFRSLADAARYCALFRTRDFPAGPSRADLAALLDETGDDVFPYYLPVRRRLALFALDLAAVGEGRGPLSLTRPA